MTITTLLPLVLLSLSPTGDDDIIAMDAEGPLFAAPVQLTANGKPMADITYPSPTLFDLNGDGKRELVIGDIFGLVRSSRSKSDDLGLEWSALSPLKDRKGVMRLNNW